MFIPHLNKSSGESIVSQFPVPVSLSLLVIVPASRADILHTYFSIDGMKENKYIFTNFFHIF